jgi:signal transduction histidine kinase
VSEQLVPTLDAERLRSLIDAGRTVVAERELDGVLARLLKVAREITGARYAAIGVLDDDREELADFITAGIDPGAHASIGELPRGRGVLGLLISNPHPLRLSDVSSHSLSYGFPPGHPRMGSFLGVPIVVRDEAWGNLYLTDKPGDGFDDADEEAAVVLASWAAIAVENARLYRETDQRRAELERSLHALEATSEIARAVGGETQLDRVLELIAKRSRALIEASAVAILLLEGDRFVIAATAGNIPREIVGTEVTRAESVAGRVVASGRPERVGDVASSLRFALAGLGVQVSSGVFVPLTFRGANLGVIEAFDRVGGPEFRTEDEQMLQSAAASAATAVATAQSVEQDRLRRTLQAAEDERRRWARELHDETLQGLGGLRVLLSSARRSQQPEALRSTIEAAVEQIGHEIDNLRSLITELRPAALDELGLEPALEALFDRMRMLHGFEIDATIDLTRDDEGEPTRLQPDIETAAYRLVQESLSNVAKHAHANHVTVVIAERDSRLRILVRDDGRGFDTGRPADGFGLTGMRERVALLAGEIELTSSPAGTMVQIELPTAPAMRRTA